MRKQNPDRTAVKEDILQIRISSDLKTKLKEKADSENRTISNYVITLILKNLSEDK